MRVRILFIRRIVQIWYNRKGNAEGASHSNRTNTPTLTAATEKTLRALLKVISRDICIVIFIEVRRICWGNLESALTGQ